MFHYAGAYSIAKANGLPFYFYDHNNIKDVFYITANLVSKKEIEDFKGTRKTSMIGRSFGFDKRMFDISHDTDTLIRPHMWSWMYFQDYEQDIKKEFLFKHEVLVEANAKLEEKTKEIIQRFGRDKTTLVGVHIRRGDTLWPVLQDRGTIQPPLSYYYNAMDYYKQTFGENTAFVYCSDGMEWVEENFQNVTAKYNILFMDSGNNWAVDMAILTLCDHSIISVGTFGWWSAYLTGGTVVHYTYVAMEGSAIREHFSTDLEDYFYPGWISME